MLTRRRAIRMLGLSGAAMAAPVWGASAAEAPRSLGFLHLHTGERLSVEYFAAGRYVPDALVSVNRLLRDFRTGDVHAIEPGLLDLLHSLVVQTGTHRPFEVISGYRSPATNAMLRQQGRGVAEHSLHMDGKAIDIRLDDVPLPRLRDEALALRAGGVGYYPESNFVHVDVGRVRRW